MSAHPARQRLRHLLAQPDDALSLSEAALCVAWEDQRLPVPPNVSAALDTMVQTVRRRLPDSADAETALAELNRYLFDELGFVGDPNCYEQLDPADSFFDRVLERRRGLPIVLSFVYLELGWRLGLALDGIGLPGHFLVRYNHPTTPYYLDPFSAGRIWSYDECLHQIGLFQGELTPEVIGAILQPAGRREMIERMLRNLKNVYLSRRDFRAALACCERILLANPLANEERRDAGLLRIRLGQILAALEDLERYAEANPRAADLYDLRAFAASIVSRSAPFN